MITAPASAPGGRRHAGDAEGRGHGADLRAPSGRAYTVEWVPIADPTATLKTSSRSRPAYRSCAVQGRSRPTCRARRWAPPALHEGKVRGACGHHLHGGHHRRRRSEGVVWAYEPSQRLTALFVSPDMKRVAGQHRREYPRGHPGVRGRRQLHGRLGRFRGCPPACNQRTKRDDLRREQHPPRPFARGRTSIQPGDYRGGEFTGGCFAPDGRTMFVNIQTPGITVAITGPFERLGL